ncbi:MAG: ABC transporter ATP-binding protein, partial [Halobacteriaceae archaeon]
MAAIDVRELSKHYGEIVANDTLSFSVKRGEIFGYLGPNGAGKTTTIRTLLGLIRPTSGTAEMFGADVRDEEALIEAKRRIGYLPDDLQFNDSVTGKRILDHHEAIKGGQRREELLDAFTPPIDRPVREYSSGNKQMLGIVQAFMHDPDLVIMDEPTGGLDPLKRNEKRQGTTIFFSSHVLSEVRRVCDRVGILRDGRLVALEDIESLLRKGGKRVHLRSPDDIRDAIGSMEAIIDLTRTGDEFQFTYTGDCDELLERLTNIEIL